MATIYGNSLDNHLAGTAYSDVIYGYGGKDYIAGGNLNDTVWGGEGDDTADGGAAMDRLYGEAGNDSLFGNAGDDMLSGGSGKDTLAGGDGNDLYAIFDAGDVIVESANGGIDEVQVGDNYASYERAFPNSYDPDLQDVYLPTPYRYGSFDLAGTNVENLTYTGFTKFFGYGSEAANVIKTAGTAAVWAMGGNDLVQALGGTLAVEGGEGNDTVVGAGSADAAAGGNGNDRLTMGGGDDHGFGDAGNDSIDGGDGEDTLVGGSGSDSLTGGLGDDTLLSKGTLEVVLDADVWYFDYLPYATLDIAFVSWRDASSHDGFADRFYGGEGNDTLAGHSGDFLDGGNGNDTYWVHGNSLATISEGGRGGVDTVRIINAATHQLGANIENLRIENDGAFGGSAAWGNTLGNWILATEAADTVRGEAGDDVLDGIGGNDVMYGGAGNDAVDGGWDNDRLEGDIGNDTVEGGEGKDQILGGDGDDQLFGNLSTAYPDTYGNPGNDTIDGGAGNDLVVGGGGADQLRGGLGADTFRFATGEAGTTTTTRDMVQDFQRGLDRIDLSLVDANPALAGDQALVLGAGPTAWGVWQAPQADNVTMQVWVDTSGDAVADMAIGVQFADGLAVAPLGAGDFIL